jgi:hypothetical protein
MSAQVGPGSACWIDYDQLDVLPGDESIQGPPKGRAAEHHYALDCIAQRPGRSDLG